LSANTIFEADSSSTSTKATDIVSHPKDFAASHVWFPAKIELSF